MTGTISIQVKEGRSTTYGISGDFKDELSLEGLFDFNKKVTISVAHDVLNEELGRGFPKEYITRVDGSNNKSELQIKAFGKIEYFAPVVAAEVLIEIYDGILKRSIVDTGTYRSNNWVFLNGEVIARTGPELKSFLAANAIKETDKVRFVNLTPYARKIETKGKSIAQKGRAKGSQVTKAKTRTIKRLSVVAKIPNGAYHLTELSVRRKFRAAGYIKMMYISGGELSSVLPRSRPTGGVFRTTFAFNKKYRKGSVGRPYLYPSIVVRFKKEGIIGDAKL